MQSSYVGGLGFESWPGKRPFFTKNSKIGGKIQMALIISFERRLAHQITFFLRHLLYIMFSSKRGPHTDFLLLKNQLLFSIQENRTFYSSGNGMKILLALKAKYGHEILLFHFVLCKMSSYSAKYRKMAFKTRS